MKLIVGLGNPGRRYAQTRHNVGFEVLGELARRHGASTPRQRFQGELSEARIADQKVLLLCPLTYMNASGGSVQPAKDFYQLEDEDLLVVCDDFALDVGVLRFRAKGSDGGQKGLADVLRRLATQQISRLRVGIGPLPPRWDVSDFVLSKFDGEQREIIDETIRRAADAVADWVAHDIQYCMNHYNAKPQ